MIFTAELGTYEAVVEAVSFHLGSEFARQNDFILFPGWFLDVEHAHVTDKREQQKAVTTIEKSLRAALVALHSLHPDVRRSVEWQIKDNLRDDDPLTWLQPFFEDEGESRPIGSNDNLELYLRAALSSFLGVPADSSNLEFSPEKPERSARSAARNSMSDLNMKSLTKQARTGGAWQKALTVKQCRQLWAYAKGEEAPVSYTESHAGNFGYGEFLSDMIEALGKLDDWPNPAGVMNAWRERSEMNDWFL